MKGKSYSLVVSLPISDEDEGQGTLEELEFRHQLEGALDRVLRKQRLGHVDGGGREAAIRMSSCTFARQRGRRRGSWCGPSLARWGYSGVPL